MKQNKIQIPEGYKNSALGIIPNDWEVKKVKELVKYIGGGAFSSNDSCDIGVKWLKIANVGINEIKWNENCFLPFNYLDKYSEWSLLEGDIVMALTRPILDGKLKISFLNKRDTPALLNQRVAKIVTSNICNNVFIYYSMQMTFFISEMESQMLGTDPPNASFDNLYKQSLLLPPLPQQQKIADILGTWDEAIEKQSKLIDKLTDRKRGLMQQLLTGKKRLAGFSEEWKEVRLGEIGETFTGLTGKTKDNFGTGDPFITYMNVYNSYQINTTQMDYVCLEKGETQNLVKYGDIFFTISSETPHEVGMSSVLLDEIENTYLNSFCFGYRLYNFTTLIPEFAKYYLRSKGIRLEMYKLAQGSTRFNLSKSEVLKIKVILPSLPEQTAIANILTAADKEIELAKSKLELLRSQKSGLMQQLLTGKTRVKID